MSFVFEDIGNLSYIKRVTLDLSSGPSHLQIYAKQNDENSRYLEVTITRNGEVFTIPDGTIARLRSKKTNGRVVYAECAIHDNKVYVDLSRVINIAGSAVADIELTVVGQILSTQSFVISTCKAPIDGTDVEDSDDLSALQEAILRLAYLDENGIVVIPAGYIKSEMIDAGEVTKDKLDRIYIEKINKTVNYYSDLDVLFDYSGLGYSDVVYHIFFSKTNFPDFELVGACSYYAFVDYRSKNSLILLNSATGEIFVYEKGANTLKRRQITDDGIASGAVGTDQIADGAVTSEKLGEKSVKTANLDTASVTGGKLADNAVTTGHILKGAVTGEKIASGAVGTDKIADDAVTEEKIADNSVDYNHLKDMAVTPEKLDREYVRLHHTASIRSESQFHNYLITGANNEVDEMEKLKKICMFSIGATEGILSVIGTGRFYGFYVSKSAFTFTSLGVNPQTFLVIFTDEKITSVEIVQNGETSGQNGFSPTIVVTPIEGGNKLTITDINGSQTVYVMNGKDGTGEGVGSIGITDLDYVVSTKIPNLFNNADFKKGTMDSAGVFTEDETGTLYSGMVAVQPNTKYYFNVQYANVYEYAEDGTFIQMKQRWGNNGFTPSSNARFINVNLTLSAKIYMLVTSVEAISTLYYYKEKIIATRELTVDEKRVLKDIGICLGEQEEPLFYFTNLYDPNAEGITNGYILNANGTETANVGSWISPYIEVEEDTTIQGNLNGFRYCLYDANKNFIIGGSFNTVSYGTAENFSFTIPRYKGIKYLRYRGEPVTYTTPGNANSLKGYQGIIGVGKTLPKNIIPANGETIVEITDKALDSIKQVITENLEEYKREAGSVSKLYGKKYVAEGDSITSTAYADKPYPLVIAEKTGCNVSDNAVSGSTVLTVINRLSKLTGDEDIVSVAVGYNDRNLLTEGVVTVGTMEDRTTDTLYGAYHTLCLGLLEKCPNSAIFFMTLFPNSGRVNEHNLQTNQIIKEVCEYYTIPVLDIYNMGNCPVHLPEYRTLWTLGDGLHYNNAGHLRLAKPIQGFMESLI